MVVPTLVDGETRLFQSLAILEWLEEKYPAPPLLSGRCRRARLGEGLRAHQHRRFASADRAAHPQLSHRHPGPDAADNCSPGSSIGWRPGSRRWKRCSREHRESGKFCHGDRVTLADIWLVTQVFPAQTFKTDIDALSARHAHLPDGDGDPRVRRRLAAEAARRRVIGGRRMRARRRLRSRARRPRATRAR